MPTLHFFKFYLKKTQQIQKNNKQTLIELCDNIRNQHFKCFKCIPPITGTTVKSAYKEPAYTELAYTKLTVVRNWFSFPNLYQGTSSLKVYKELLLYETDLYGPNMFL